MQLLIKDQTPEYWVSECLLALFKCLNILPDAPTNQTDHVVGYCVDTEAKRYTTVTKEPEYLREYYFTTSATPIILQSIKDMENIHQHLTGQKKYLKLGDIAVTLTPAGCTIGNLTLSRSDVCMLYNNLLPAKQ